MPLYTRGGQSSQQAESKIVALSNVYICQIISLPLALRNILWGQGKNLDLAILLIRAGRGAACCVIIRL
jgi:hypothetical protein